MLKSRITSRTKKKNSINHINHYSLGKTVKALIIKSMTKPKIIVPGVN